MATASNVYATYVIYYFASGEISAARAIVSDLYNSSNPNPIVESNPFDVSYPSGATGIKIRSFSTDGIDCSAYGSAEGCWLAALDAGEFGYYHDEVRYCIVDTAERDFDQCCQSDGIDLHAPLIEEMGWPLVNAAWAISSALCGTPEVWVSDCVSVTLDATPSAGLSPLTFYWDSRVRSYPDNCDPTWGAWTSGPVAVGVYSVIGGLQWNVRLRVVNSLGSADTLTTAFGGSACDIVLP